MNLPDDVTEIVRTVAGAVPPHAGDLAAVRSRGRARVRHRALAATGSVALAVVAAIGAPVVLTGPEAAPPTSPPPAASGTPTESPAPAPAAQRLLLDGANLVTEIYIGEGEDDGAEPPPGTAREAYEWYQNRPNAVGVLAPLAEIRPDGVVVDLTDLPEVDSVQQMVAMPDGRLAAIGLVDLMPGVERTDGPCVAGIATPLLVVERDGSVSVFRDLRVRCQTVTLVSADTGTAYLLRDDQLVAHDLATGAERVLLEPASAGQDYAGGRLAGVVHSNEPACGPGTVGRLVLRVAEVATGATADHQVPADGCTGHGGQLRLSPDGRYAAHVYLAEDGIRIAIFDLDRDGTVVADRLVSDAGEERDRVGQTGHRGIAVWARTGSAGVVGLAWDDPDTLRLAWYEVPGNRVYWLPDVLQQTTIDVPA